MRKMPRKRVYQLFKKDIREIGGLISEDEIFLPCPKEASIWISNYARVISKRRGKPKLLKTVFQKGYQRLTLNAFVRGRKIRHQYYLHVLVADLFVEKADWIDADDKVEAHHIIAVDREKDIPNINITTNLMYVPRKLHKVIDSVAEIFVDYHGKWKMMNFQEASAYYGISPYEFFEFFGNEKNKPPNKKRGKYQYYSGTIEHEDASVNINIRIVRTRDVNM